MTEVDQCVTVTDDPIGALFGGAEVCATDAQTTFTTNYTTNVGGYDVCGDYQFTNTASFTTVATAPNPAATGSASWTVDINVPCAGGCTLTQGYWKTHSEFGPAPYDSTWAQLPNGASTPFYYSGKTWYQVFQTSPAGGNAYYQLAHQYMAARLNVLNGAATTPAVDAALAGALAYFNNPANTGNRCALRRDAHATARLGDHARQLQQRADRPRSLLRVNVYIDHRSRGSP